MCDEPEGTNLCPEGTDPADCAIPETCDAAGSCSGCVECSIQSTCLNEYDLCANGDECIAFYDCALECDALGDPTCLDACTAAHPEGKALFDAYAACVICAACPAACAGEEPIIPVECGA